MQAACCCAEENGAIAICCELAIAPGPALRRLASVDSRETALRQVSKERPVDALPAVQLAQTLQQHPVYLLSKLEPSVLEDLDIIPIADIDELIRLAQHHTSCTLLANAPYVTAVLRSE